MNHKRLAICLLVWLCYIGLATALGAQEKTAALGQQDAAKTAAKNDAPEPRRNGKKLLTSLDLMRVAAVSAPRISPDGTRVAYLVSETKIEKDKNGKQSARFGLPRSLVVTLANSPEARRARPQLNGLLTAKCWRS